jgi:murein DD-endopeptidase MepM/ murein hydrolase activator NlpD
MPRPTVSSRSRAFASVAVLALVGVSAAGCADSARFDSNPFASNHQAPPPQQEVTGSVGGQRPMYRPIESQPLPAPSQPATVAPGVSSNTGGVSYGAQGLGAYRPPSDVTGSVTERPAAAAPVIAAEPPKAAGHWTWDGGTPVSVRGGETVDSIARRHNVPAWAILQTNGIREASAVRPGQRLVIPRYVAEGAPHVQAPHRVAAAPAPVQAPAPARVAAGESVHTVQAGESLMRISRRYDIPLSELARANKMQPYTKVEIGQRIVIPGGHREAAAPRPAPAMRTAAAQPQVMQAPVQAPPPQIARPQAAPPVQKVETAPVQTARMATEEPANTDTVVKQADAAGGLPSFRWPVKGRIISAFGAKTNGAQNDGINLAVPEGTPVKAAEDGVVAYAGNELKGYGNLVLIRHADGFVSAYANASELLVKRGDSVKRGQTIAHAGQTGNVTSPQLHFEIRKGSTPVDPTKYLGGA